MASYFPGRGLSSTPCSCVLKGHSPLNSTPKIGVRPGKWNWDWTIVWYACGLFLGPVKNFNINSNNVWQLWSNHQWVHWQTTSILIGHETIADPKNAMSNVNAVMSPLDTETSFWFVTCLNKSRHWLDHRRHNDGSIISTIYIYFTPLWWTVCLHWWT